MDLMTFAQSIDHTLLKPDATIDQLQKLCDEAKTHHFFSVCVHPSYIQASQKFLKDSQVKICTVVGFPLGAMTTDAKAFETRQAVELGAQEIDMVVAIGAVKNGDWAAVEADIRGVVVAANGQLVKVILETCFLTDAEKIKVCEISKAAGAQFVKTSTGFGSAGATVADVALMRQTVGPAFGVKASGGIRDWPTAKAMLDAGANRLGLSASVAILKELI